MKEDNAQIAATAQAANFSKLVGFLWSIADLLNGSFTKSQFQGIILPFTVLRRLDYALAPTKQKVLETEKKLKAQGLQNRHGQLCRASGFSFYNISKFDYEGLLRDDANLARNLRQYVHGFSPNVREIFDAFNFDDAIRDLEKAGLLYLLMERFNEKSKVDLRPSALSNHQMGYVFEHLLRRFNEALNANPGEHFTPREVIRLLVDLVLMFDTKLGTLPGVSRRLSDCCCGSGGILSIAKDQILAINPKAQVHLYGQELNPQTWAIARSDMLMLDPGGKDAENIKLGSTLSNDQLVGERFDYQFVNPPYGYEWSKDKVAVQDEAARGFAGRFGAGLPRISDGQMLFLQHLISRMHDPKEGPSYIGIILNGSPLFTGDAGSGESEIRRWIFENDWLEAIVALPQQIFYNTGISTYMWLLNNDKPASRRGKVLLFDASGEEFWTEMTKSLGSKRREISDEQRAAIVRHVRDRKPSEHLKIFSNDDFGYRQIRVERPLRLRFEVDAAALARLAEETAFKNLAISKKKDATEKKREEAAGAKLQDQIRAALSTLEGKEVKNRAKFAQMVEKAASAADLKLKAPVVKAILNAVGQRDESADICQDADGNSEPDKELTDYENVPFNEDIDAYFAREVAPHVPDAWIDRSYRDPKDEKVGLVGYEIPFNRHFYKYTPPEPLEKIEAEIKTLESEIMELLKEVTA
jgi:type I restriction enzyme M protein